MLVIILLTITQLFAQQKGTKVPEKHLPITWQRCTKAGCTDVKGSIVLDLNWRDLHEVGGDTECEDPEQKKWGGFNKTICPDPKTCAKNCEVEGANYDDYGIKTSGNQVSLIYSPPKKSVTDTGSRVYLMDENDKNYEGFVLNGKEFSYDMDIHEVPCGMNAALYFVQMDLDGGASHGAAGASYGTGYCDAQCPKWIKFVNGEANLDRTSTICCFELDIWEGNTGANVFTPHNCPTITGEVANKTNVCDGGGCGFNSYKVGAHNYYGPGMTVNSNSKFTVVTQFPTDDGTPSGKLKEIRRLYVQGGKVIQNAKKVVEWSGQELDSISDDYCGATSAQYVNNFGGSAETGRALKDPQVLAMSLWASDDGMGWLDSGDAGPCAAVSADTLNRTNPNAHIYFSNIKVGDIDTTYK